MYIANNDIKLAGNRYKAGEQIPSSVIDALDESVVTGLILDGHVTPAKLEQIEAATEEVEVEVGLEPEPEPEQVIAEEVETVTALKDEDYKPSYKKRR